MQAVVQYLGLYIRTGVLKILTQPLKCQTKIAADDILIFYFDLSKKIGLIFQMNPLPSRGFTWNIKSYFLWKTMKKYLWMSAAVVIGALRVNYGYSTGTIARSKQTVQTKIRLQSHHLDCHYLPFHLHLSGTFSNWIIKPIFSALEQLFQMIAPN